MNARRKKAIRPSDMPSPRIWPFDLDGGTSALEAEKPGEDVEANAEVVDADMRMRPTLRAYV